MIIKNHLYNNSVELIFNEFKHQYFIDGKKIPSVTSILSVINKPALINWAANMAVGYIENEIKPGESYDEIQLNTIFNEARKAHTKKKQDAAEIGTMVHAWINKYIKGLKPEMPVSDQLRASIELFLEWQRKNNVEFLLSEQPIYSLKHNFTGTLDFIAKIDGALVLGDVKTSTGIWDEYWYQTAAYQLAREEEFPEETYDYRGIIRIGKDGVFEWAKSLDGYEMHCDAFIACRQLFEVLETMKQKQRASGEY